jgi:hypothetical protein
MEDLKEEGVKMKKIRYLKLTSFSHLTMFKILPYKDFLAEFRAGT